MVFIVFSREKKSFSLLIIVLQSPPCPFQHGSCIICPCVKLSLYLVHSKMKDHAFIWKRQDSESCQLWACYVFSFYHHIDLSVISHLCSGGMKKNLIPSECLLVTAETKHRQTTGMHAEDLPSVDGRRRPS